MLTDGTTSYIYGPGGLPVEQAGSAGTPTYLHQDQLGSTRLLTDPTGAVTGTYSYDAYGNTTSHTGTATTPLQYAGQYNDPETGLYYLRNRYYDPATAQFLTTDPLVSLTQAPYSYVDGNPLNDTDPTGLCDFVCAVGLGAVVVATAACIVVEPCGLAEGGAVALAGGGTAAIGITFTGAGILATGAAAGGLAGASVYTLASGNNGNNGNNGGTCPQNNPAGAAEDAGGVEPRDIHGADRVAERGVDVQNVLENGQLYYQDDGQLVRVLDNGNGTSDIVIRDPSNPSGVPTTVIKDMPDSQVQARITSGRWWG